jgi:hypothetical protein
MRNSRHLYLLIEASSGLLIGRLYIFDNAPKALTFVRSLPIPPTPPSVIAANPWSLKHQ